MRLFTSACRAGLVAGVLAALACGGGGGVSVRPTTTADEPDPTPAPAVEPAPTPEPAPKARGGNNHGAWAYMQLFVEKDLKSPSSANFPFGGGTRHVTDLKNDKYYVNSYVDSENSFGANIRTYFHGVIEEAGGKWKLHFVEYSQRPIPDADLSKWIDPDPRFRPAPMPEELAPMPKPEPRPMPTPMPQPEPTPEPEPMPVVKRTADETRQYLTDHLAMLERFAGTDDFKIYGFAKSSPHHQWMRTAEEWAGYDHATPGLADAVKSLRDLGKAYANSGGKETETTRTLASKINEAIRSED